MERRWARRPTKRRLRPAKEESMNAVLTSLSLLTASLVGCATQADDAGPARPTDVVVNSMPLSQDNLQRLEQLLRVRLRPGRYWYDARSGLAGVEGQGASALLP